VLTLYLTPVVYIYFEQFQEMGMSRGRKDEGEGEAVTAET